MIILTNHSPDQWGQTIQEIKNKFSVDLSLFEPKFITYNELLLLEGNAWDEYKTNITQGRSKKIVVVVQTKRNQMEDLSQQNKLNVIDRQDLIRKNAIVLISKD